MSNLRKTASKNSTRKLQQQLAQLPLDSPAGSRSGSRAGSRAGSRLASRANSEDEDDAYSETSAADYDDDNGWPGQSGNNYQENRETSLESQIKEAIEELQEKRGSTREEALSKLSTYLSQRYTAEALDSELDELMDLLKKSIKRGSTRECVAAAGVVSLVFITSGEDDEKMFTDLAPLLKYTITNHEQTEVKTACIHALATACYISSVPQPSHLPSYDLLNFFADIAVSKGESVNAHQNGDTLRAALEAFSVLYAGLFGRGLGHNRQLMMQARRLFNKVIDPLELLLEHSSVEVRVASGEAMALLFEILHQYQRQRDEGEISDDEDEGDSETYRDDEEEDYDEVTGDFRFDGLSRVIDTLGSLSTDSSRHRSKKERSTGRSAFRDILKSVESDEKPSELLRLKDYEIPFRGWMEILQLHYLRDRLTSGMQTHFVHNPTIHGFLPATAILYSPGIGGEDSRFGGGNNGGGSRMGSQAGSRTASRAGSRPSSAMGHYGDSAEDPNAEMPMSKLDRKYLNAEMAKMRQIQRKRDRGRDKFGDDY